LITIYIYIYIYKVSCHINEDVLKVYIMLAVFKISMMVFMISIIESITSSFHQGKTKKVRLLQRSGEEIRIKGGGGVEKQNKKKLHAAVSQVMKADA
jgi:hypothetical protein